MSIDDDEERSEDDDDDTDDTDDDDEDEDEDESETSSIQRLSAEYIRVFEKTEAQLEGFYEEIGVISKKKPEDAVNKFKLGFVNQMLSSANSLLGDEYRPFPDFEQFDLDTVPTTSDVVTMLSQYLRSMDKLRKDCTYNSLGTYYWRSSDSGIKIRARHPKNFER